MSCPEPPAPGRARHPVHAAAGHRLGAAHPRRQLPADLRLVGPAAGAWAGAALLLRAPAGRAALVVAGCVLAALALAAAGRRGRRPVAVAGAAVLLCAAAGGAVAGLHAAALRSGGWTERAGERTTAEVTLTGDPRQARPKPGARQPRPVLLTAEVTRDGGRPVRAPVLVVVETAEPGPWLALLPSTRLRLPAARVAAPLPGRAHEIAAVLRVSGAGPPPVTGRAALHHRVAGALRDRLRDAAAVLPADARALFPALVAGDDSAVPPDLERDVRAAGLTHLVVVSGSHVAIVLGVLIGPAGTAARAERRGLAARLGVPLRATAVLGGLLVLAFVLVCRPGPSVLRAALCGGAALLALATGRRRELLPALAAATLLLVLWEPVLARSFGFLLSVLAAGSLLTLAPRWSDALRRRGVPGRVAEGLGGAAAAHAVCAPVVTVFASGTSLVAVPCNLLAEPAVAPVIVLGWAALLLAPVAMPAATALVWLAGWPARWIAAVARAGGGLPGAELGWPAGWSGALLLAGALAGAGVLLRRAVRRPSLALLCTGVLLLAVLRPAPLVRVVTGWPPPGWRLAVCDVGQGDGLVLAAGGGSALVVDAGPDPAAMDRCLRDLGVRHVPLLVLTHFHADHVAGLPGVLRGRRVDAIRVSPVPDSPDQAEFVARVAADAGVPVRPVGAGERGAAGDDLAWEVLWPPAGAARDGLGANDASVTLLVRTAGLTVFLPGDLEQAGQERLLATRPRLGRVDVVKVAHHGSADQHPALLDRLRPALALVSCGADNTYGHPAPRTLAALDAAGVTVLRTDRHGALAVTGGGDGPRGVVQRPP